MDTLIRDFAPYDYPVLAAVRNAACPRDPTSAGQLKDGDERYPEAIKRGRWVAELRDCVVGVGEYTQSTDLYHPRKFRLIIYVNPRYQGQGIGSMLYEHLVHELWRYEPIAYQARALENESSTLRFLARRGFTEDFRQWESHLDVTGFDLERWQPVEDRVQARGIRIVTLADLPASDERDRRLYDLEQEVEANIPSPDSVRNSVWPRDDDRFQRYADHVLNDPDRSPWSYLVATKDGEYVGLSYGDENRENSSFDIDLTGVRQAYRGLGVATALKVKGIARAGEHGFTTVRTWNDIANTPILGLNDKLGFVRQPALIFFEAPARADHSA